MKTITIDEMADALIKINFFVGGLTDKAIEHYYNLLILKND
jgi:hypothetical protein